MLHPPEFAVFQSGVRGGLLFAPTTHHEAIIKNG